MSTGLWKHIGLHGHSVGTFSCEDGGIKWTSALTHESVQGSTKSVPKEAITSAQWTAFGKSGHIRLQTNGKNKLHHELRFDGFPVAEFENLRNLFKSNYGVDLMKYTVSSAGTQYGISKMTGKKLTFRHCILEDADEEGEEFEVREGDEMMSLDLAEVSQCVLPGNNRNEIELQFPESDAVEANNDQLVSIRFYIPPDQDQDPGDKTIKTPAELLQQKIMSTANIRKTTGDVIVEFDHEKGSFLTPRGRYSIELYDRFFRMRGQKYDYKIKYDDISRLFLLPKPDDVHMAFVIALDKPIRQGQQRYQHLVLQTSKETDEVQVNLDEATLEKEYKNELQPVMRGSFSNLVAKTFKVIANKKVFIPGKFQNANAQACVKCALRANEGLLYPLEKQFVFIHKPPVLVRFNEIESVEFQRYAGGTGSTRNFDLAVFLKSSAASGSTSQEYIFSGIDRSDYQSLYDFLSSKNISIKNLQETAEETNVAPVYNEDEIYGGPDDDELNEESEDEDYDQAAAEKDAEANAASDSEASEDLDDDEFGDEIDDDLDSDLEEARGGKRKSADSDDDDDDSDMIVDDLPKKRKKSKKGDADSPSKKKAKKDPNAPKKALTAWVIYATEHRERVKKENPEAGFGEITKILSQEYKNLSSEEQKKYNDKAKADKARYASEMADYEPPAGFAASGKAKGKKKTKKDPNAPKRGKNAFMHFSAAMRAKIKEENPEMSVADIAKKTGEMYRSLPPEEKEKYDKLAARDKETYDAAMEAYNQKKKDEAAAQDDDDDDSDGVDEEVEDDEDSDDDSD